MASSRPATASHVFLALEAPGLTAVLQMRFHEGRAKGNSCSFRPAGHSSVDAAQDAVDLLGYKDAVLAHMESLTNYHAKVLLHRATLNPFLAQACICPWN